MTLSESLDGYTTHRVADIQDERGLMLIESTTQTGVLRESGESLAEFGFGVGKEAGNDGTGFLPQRIDSGEFGPISIERTTHLSYERSGGGSAAALVHTAEQHNTGSVTLEGVLYDAESDLDGTFTLNINITLSITYTREDVSAG